MYLHTFVWNSDDNLKSEYNLLYVGFQTITSPYKLADSDPVIIKRPINTKYIFFHKLISQNYLTIFINLFLSILYT